jgi:hypothetical protein
MPATGVAAVVPRGKAASSASEVPPRDSMMVPAEDRITTSRDRVAPRVADVTAVPPEMMETSHGVVFAVFPGCTVHVPDCVAAVHRCPVLLVMHG